jgi:imidazolonepropionase-like amidohydrolase
VSQARIDRFKRNLDAAVSILEYAHRQGVVFMCGTDSGFAITPYGEWHAREMELFVKYLGMSALDAITSGTRHSAIAIDADNVGTLEPGKLADVLVVDGDPVRDIALLQDKARIRAVLKGGTPVTLGSRKSATRWPWERAMIMTQSELTYGTVYGGGK